MGTTERGKVLKARRKLCYKRCSVLCCDCWIPRITPLEAEIILDAWEQRVKLRQLEQRVMDDLFRVTGRKGDRCQRLELLRKMASQLGQSLSYCERRVVSRPNVWLHGQWFYGIVWNDARA